MAVKSTQMDKDLEQEMEKVRLNLWLNRRQYDELKELANYEGRSVSDIVRQVLNAHLRDNQQDAKKGAR